MNWDTIEGVDGWARALNEILSRLQGALEARNGTSRDLALKELRDFVKYSPNSFAQPLDSLAVKVALEVVATTWEEASDKLKARSIDLEALTKTLNAQAAENIKAAASARVTKATDVIAKSSAAIEAFLNLREALEHNGAEDILDILGKIDAAVVAVRDVRKALNNEA